MFNKRIDVILPFHRNDQFLQDAISSLNQSEEVDLRILLIDTRPQHSQNTPIEIQSHFPIEIVDAKSARSYGEAVNLGFSILKNEIFALMNSDDLVHPKRFINQINKMEKDGADFNLCMLQKFSKNRKKISSLSGSLSYSTWQFPYLFLGPDGADATLLGKSEVIKEKNLKFSKSIQSDWIFALCNYKEMNISILRFVGYYYRMHEKQITRSSDFLEMNSCVIKLIWDELTAIGFNIENLTIVQSIAMPYTKPRLSKGELRSLSSVVSRFLETFPDTKKNDLKKLLARRIIFATFFNRKIFSVDIKLWRFLFTELIKIGREFIISDPRMNSA